MELNLDGPKKTVRKVRIGNGVIINDFTNLYECEIGEETKIGTFVEIQKNVKIGSKCKISSHTFICEGVEIGDGVFIGHGVTFVNDKYPRSTNEYGELKTGSDWNLIRTSVADGASIGSGATILCGVKIGKNSMVGAGSVVTKDVADNTTVAGNPARQINRGG
jgi:UDP-2-acetamido-3-amino-2,3-dideoxy-glucuronate N-acetyltransferase